MANSLQKTKGKQPFSVAIQSDTYKNLINNTLGSKKGEKFVADISSLVATNPQLKECDAGTILAGGLLGASLNLSASPTLGQYYLVPFNDTKNGRKTATFILGWKGLYQLAVRSGYYKKINVVAVKEGEFKSWDVYEENFEYEPITNPAERIKAKTVGYYAMFEYLSGFRKVMYWTKEEMESHALEYSKGYKAKKGYTFWEKDFDEMAKKTMLRQLISKYGMMSVEMEQAYTKDNAQINTDGSYNYVDNVDDEDIFDDDIEIVEAEKVDVLD